MQIICKPDISWYIQVRIKPGESALAFYTAENRSSTPITGISTYNVTPMKVYGCKLHCAYDVRGYGFSSHLLQFLYLRMTCLVDVIFPYIR